MKLKTSTILKYVQGATDTSPGRTTPDEAKILRRYLKEEGEELLPLKNQIGMLVKK